MSHTTETQYGQRQTESIGGDSMIELLTGLTIDNNNESNDSDTHTQPIHNESTDSDNNTSNICPQPLCHESSPYENMLHETTTISVERLHVLEEIERNLPQMIKDAIEQHKKEKLKLLHEKDKLDPKSVNARVKRYAQKHKDEINAKRRAKREEQKLLANMPSTNSSVKSEKSERKKETIELPKTDKNLTLRFDD